MGRAYHGQFATFMEVSRVEMLRSAGWVYREMEKEGILLPVLDLSLKFIGPVFYDENLTITTKVVAPPTARIQFVYEGAVDGRRVFEGETTLAFVSAASGKPMRAPQALCEALGY
jgi:acyl-CoA thioester hydrolase